MGYLLILSSMIEMHVQCNSLQITSVNMHIVQYYEIPVKDFKTAWKGFSYFFPYSSEQPSKLYDLEIWWVKTSQRHLNIILFFIRHFTEFLSSVTGSSIPLKSEINLYKKIVVMTLTWKITSEFRTEFSLMNSLKIRQTIHHSVSYLLTTQPLAISQLMTN